MIVDPIPSTGVNVPAKLTPMRKTQVYLPDQDLDALHRIAERDGRSVASLIREAVQRVHGAPPRDGPVALWDGTPRRVSVDHDSIYDEP